MSVLTGVVGDHLQRPLLAQEPAVVQAQHDVRDDPQTVLGEHPQRTGEVRGGQVEVVDVADRLVRADDVQHHPVHAGLGKPAGQLRRDDPGVDDHLHSEFRADARHVA